MNFLSIEYFAAVASEHSFSKAAKRLGITQQTLSANIAALERELGCTLFVRHVPLELTYAGTVFARYAQRFRRDRDALAKKCATSPAIRPACCAWVLPTRVAGRSCRRL